MLHFTNGEGRFWDTNYLPKVTGTLWVPGGQRPSLPPGTSQVPERAAQHLPHSPPVAETRLAQACFCFSQLLF